MNRESVAQRSDIEISLPLYDKFFKLQRRIKQQFPHENISWPQAIGIAHWNPLSRLKNGGYHCTPNNSLAFAWTGTDGEHFSFLVKDSKITARAPIILTVPTNYGSTYNVVVAKDFHTFLRLLLRYGWFELTELAYQPKFGPKSFHDGPRVFRKCRTDEPDATARERELCAFVAGLLGLPPHFYTAEEFDALQQKYLPSLVMPEEFDAH